MTKKNKKLKAANAKQKQKQENCCTYISQREDLTVKEEMNCVQSHDKEKKEMIEQANS